MSRPAVNACDHLVAFVCEHPWAITESMRDVIAGILARRIVGQGSDEDEIAAAVKMRRQSTMSPDRPGVAVIPVHGPIAPRMNLLSDISGGATFDQLTGQLHEAVAANPRAIIFDVDSPGGNVAGATEFAREVLKARAKVPIIAQAEHLMASAAYWFGSCATEVVASPSALVGSIGVYSLYDDISAALDKLGIKREVISAGKYKAEGVDGGPLSEEARIHRKGIVDKYMNTFVSDVAYGRGVTPAAVRGGFGEGRVVPADEALSLGMITRVATLAETLDRYLTPATAGSPASQTGSRVTDQERPAAATSQECAIRASDFELLRYRWQAEGLL